MRSFSDTLGQVFRAIMANKLRSFLTMFGIAWGVGSLLVLVGLGEGFREGQHKELSQFGQDVVMVFNGTIPALANQHTGMRPYELTLGDEAAMRRLPEVRAVTGELARSDLYEVSQWSNTSAHLSGNEPSYTVVRYLPIAFGRFLDDEDVRQARRVVFIGQKSASILFQGRPMVGETISINGTNFTVIGVGAKVGRGNNTYDDEKMYIPITTMQELFPLKGDNIPQDALNSIQYNPAKKNDNTAADIAVHRVIAQRHGFDPSLLDAFNEWDTITESHMIGVIFSAMDVFLGSVGVVTLALGAVGIINIMLVSVTERTRDIGVMKAVGATRRSISRNSSGRASCSPASAASSASLCPGHSWPCCRLCSLTRFPASIRRASFPGRRRWRLERSPSAASLPASTPPAKPRALTPSKHCAGSEKCCLQPSPLSLGTSGLLAEG